MKVKLMKKISISPLKPKTRELENTSLLGYEILHSHSMDIPVSPMTSSIHKNASFRVIILPNKNVTRLLKLLYPKPARLKYPIGRKKLSSKVLRKNK